jgi:ABC-2 type transport system ATP-binding protein
MEQSAIEIRGLEKRFPGFQLGPLDLTVPQGAMYGYIGPNGAGKTTTIDLIMGLGAKNAGIIRVFGMDHLGEEVAVKRRIGYVSPDLDFKSWGTVKRLINFYRSFYPDWDDDYCTDLLTRLKIGWKEKIQALSFGARIKLGLVLALSHRPDLLLLDEPLIGLDAVSKQDLFTELLGAVQDEARTVFISSHNLDDIERFTDHVGILKNGKLLLEGPTPELIERFRMVHCSASNSANADGIDGVYVQRLEGEHWRLLADMRKDTLAQLEARGFHDIAAAPVSLEELFVALVKE